MRAFIFLVALFAILDPAPAVAQEEELATCSEFLRYQENIFLVCEGPSGEDLVYNLVENRVQSVREEEYPPGAERIGPGHEDHQMLANFAAAVGSFSSRLAYEKGRADEREAQARNTAVCQRISYGELP